MVGIAHLHKLSIAHLPSSFRKTVEINGKPHVFDIVDSAGQEEYRFVSQSYLQMSHGFLIVYSVNDPSSLNEAKIIYNSLKDLRDLEKVPCLLIGNKIDLETRAVSEEQGRALADIWKCGYFETSAKEFINIEEAFLTLAELVIQQKRVNDELRAQAGAPTRGLLRLCTVL